MCVVSSVNCRQLTSMSNLSSREREREREGGGERERERERMRMRMLVKYRTDWFVMVCVITSYVSGRLRGKEKKI